MTFLPPPPEWRPSRRRSRAAARGGPVRVPAGLLLPARPTPYWQVGLFVILTAGFLGLSAAAVVVAVRGRPGALAALLPFLPLALLFGGGAYAGVRSRRTHPDRGLLLTPTHLVLGTFPTPVPVPWHQVTRIGAVSIRYGVGPFPDPVSNLVTVFGTDESQLAALPGPARRLALRSLRRTGELALVSLAETVWAMDPVLALHVLRWYLAHPGDRPELAGGAALDRIERGAVML